MELRDALGNGFRCVDHYKLHSCMNDGFTQPLGCERGRACSQPLFILVLPGFYNVLPNALLCLVAGLQVELPSRNRKRAKTLALSIGCPTPVLHEQGTWMHIVLGLSAVLQDSPCIVLYDDRDLVPCCARSVAWMDFIDFHWVPQLSRLSGI